MMRSHIDAWTGVPARGPSVLPSVAFFAAAAIAALMLTGCGNLRAPSFTSPVETSTAPDEPNMGRVIGGSYIVAPGDTLATVSARTNTPIRALIERNRLVPPYVLRPGQRLIVQERDLYVVQAGDSVSALAQRFQVPRSAIVSLNGLQPPYTLRIGQQLLIPAPGEGTTLSQNSMKPAVGLPQPKPAPAPVTSRSPQVSSQPLPPVASGTGSGGKPQPGAKPLSGTSHLQASPSSSAAPPQSPPLPAPKPKPAAQPAPIVEPEPIVDPDAPVDQPVAAPAPGPMPQPAPSAAAQPAPEPAPAPESEAIPQSASKAGFIWPADGRVVSRFGATADGLRNDGINIAAPAGAPVRAAAAGTVAYAGSQLRGFGNLILVRHETGYITAYAHNQSLLVAKGDKVKRGQVIARIGSTGNVDKPQLHFEIRKGEEPVDPLQYLTAR